MQSFDYDVAMRHKSGCILGKISDLAVKGVERNRSIKKIIKDIKNLRKSKKKKVYSLTFPLIAKLKKICASKFSAIFDLSTSVSWPNCVKKMILGLARGYQIAPARG